MSDTWRPIRYAIAHNKKLARAGGPAAWLYVGGLLYAHQHATDGHLDEAVIGSLVAGYTTRETTKATSALLACGLWEPDIDGFYIHDWDDENDPADLLLTRRASNRRRQQIHRSPDLRQQIRVRDEDRCRYCNRTVDWKNRRGPGGGTYDHVNPSGDNVMENLVIACRGCNSAKGSRTPTEAGMDILPVPKPIRLASQNEI